MARKSRYQLVNRGRPGRARWYMTDAESPDYTGRYVGTSRAEADHYLRFTRKIQRERDERVAQGYHLPGL